MPITLQIEGLSQLLNSMQSLPGRIKDDVDAELTATADNMVETAKKLAPVDMGNLWQHIRVTRNEPLEKWVSSEAEYSAYVEFGTGTRVSIWPFPKDLEGYALQFKGAGKRQINLPARPFFFPAYQAHTQDLVKRLKQIIEQDANKK